MFFIFGVGFLLLVAANITARLLGLSKSNWLYSLEISMRYLHMVGWTSILLILAGFLSIRPTIAAAFVITFTATILGYFSEQVQEHFEKSGKIPD